MKNKEIVNIICPFCNFCQKLIVDFSTSTIFITCDTEAKTYRLVETDDHLLANIVFNLKSEKHRNLWFLSSFEEIDDMAMYEDIKNYEEFVDGLDYGDAVLVDPAKILSNY